jgi:hypothetical protein
VRWPSIIGTCTLGWGGASGIWTKLPNINMFGLTSPLLNGYPH